MRLPVKSHRLSRALCIPLSVCDYGLDADVYASAFLTLHFCCKTYTSTTFHLGNVSTHKTSQKCQWIKHSTSALVYIVGIGHFPLSISDCLPPWDPHSVCTTSPNIKVARCVVVSVVVFSPARPTAIVAGRRAWYLEKPIDVTCGGAWVTVVNTISLMAKFPW